MRALAVFVLLTSVLTPASPVAAQSVVRSDAEALVVVELPGHRVEGADGVVASLAMIVYARPQPSPGRPDVDHELRYPQARCADNQFHWISIVRFSSPDELLPVDRWWTPQPGSIDAVVFNALCGRPAPETLGRVSWSEDVAGLYREAVATGALPFRGPPAR